MALILLLVSSTILAGAVPAQAAAIGLILQGTPWWVYALFALLLYLGLQATRPRSLGLPRLLALPAVFIIWGASPLLLKPGLSAGSAADWLATAVLGAGLALLTTPAGAWPIDRAQGLVQVPGSWLPLARNLAIFAAKYGLAIAAALQPQARDQLALWDLAVSGLSAGYFLGWLARFLSSWRQAQPAAPAASAASLPAGDFR